VVAYRGVDHRAGKAISAVQTTRASVLPAIESTIRCVPCAAIRIDRQTGPDDRTFGSGEPNDNIGFTVSEASQLAGSVGDPNAVMLIGAKEICAADDRVNRNVLDAPPVSDSNQMVLSGRDCARHQHPDVAVAVLAERTRDSRSGERTAVGA